MLTPEQEQLARALMAEAVSLAEDLKRHQDELLQSGGSGKQPSDDSQR